MVNVDWSKTSRVVKIFIKFQVSAATTVKQDAVKNSVDSFWKHEIRVSCVSLTW